MKLRSNKKLSVCFITERKNYQCINNVLFWEHKVGNMNGRMALQAFTYDCVQHLECN